MAFTGIYFLSQHDLGLSLWVWVLLFFSPDISMLGYVVNNKVGAISYNIFHHKGVAIALAFAGFFVGNEVLLAVGALLFAHSSFDRMLGYGLKYASGFGDTHLGKVGRSHKKEFHS